MKRSSEAGRADQSRHPGTREIRETEAATRLLERQLHSLYWWLFNASRIKGFLRAKQLDETGGEEDSPDSAPSTAPDQDQQS